MACNLILSLLFAISMENKKSKEFYKRKKNKKKYMGKKLKEEEKKNLTLETKRVPTRKGKKKGQSHT